MAARLSKALRNYINSKGSLKDALQGGKGLIYSGPQPATADAAPTGTLLCVITDNSGSHTAEVQAQGRATIAGASGSIDSIEVNGIEMLPAAVPFTTDLTTTAAKIVKAINANPENQMLKAANVGAAITFTMERGWGAKANGFTVVTTGTTLTSTDVNIGSTTAGVSSANGIKFGESANGLLDKLDTQTLSGVGIADGVAGYMRIVGAVTDSGIVDSTESQIRMDLAIATSGAQLTAGSTGISTGATQTLASLPITLPTA